LLIGLISDTHDCLPLVDKAVKRLNDENVDLVLHAGDYVSPFVIPKFKDLRMKLIGVFGNNDGDHELLKQRFGENDKLEIHGNYAELNFDDLKVVLLHGSDKELLKSLIDSDSFDIIVHGHTHNAETYKREQTLVVNPGEVCGYLSGKPTIAVLDTKNIEARIVDL
jgi:putative phosphoesterase